VTGIQDSDLIERTRRILCDAEQLRAEHELLLKRSRDMKELYQDTAAGFCAMAARRILMTYRLT
jgi:hypothetical protein